MARPLVIGIDSGIKGAIAYYKHGHSCMVDDLPYCHFGRGKCALDLDTVEFVGRLKSAVQGPPPAVFVEQVNSRPRQAGQFYFGLNTGRILGAVEALGWPVTLVAPNRWKRAVGLRSSNKELAHRLAADLWLELFNSAAPFYGSRGALLDGRAEAFLIALYGFRFTHESAGRA
jgi:crossover junction endodeoxyribonuclease RuvC